MYNSGKQPLTDTSLPREKDGAVKQREPLDLVEEIHHERAGAHNPASGRLEARVVSEQAFQLPKGLRSLNAAHNGGQPDDFPSLVIYGERAGKKFFPRHGSNGGRGGSLSQ